MSRIDLSECLDVLFVRALVIDINVFSFEVYSEDWIEFYFKKKNKRKNIFTKSMLKIQRMVCKIKRNLKSYSQIFYAKYQKMH